MGNNLCKTLLPGETVIIDLTIPGFTSVKNTDIQLAGETFTGNLNREDFGTTVSPAGSGSSSNTFIVDFHAFRTVIGVSANVCSIPVESVYMWLGTNFFTKGTEASIIPDLLDTVNIISYQYPYTYKYFTEVNTPKIKVELNSELSLDEFKNNFEVLGRSFPLNLRAKLGDEDPFWAAPGEFSKTATLPPLAETLERLKSQGNGSEIEIPLVLISDAPGKVEVRKKEISYHLEKIQINDNDTAKVLLTAGSEETITFKSPPIGDPGAQIHLDRVGFEAGGVILSDMGVKVSPVFTAAIKIEPPEDITLRGFKVLLGKDVSPDLELFAEIQPDQEGEPAAEETLASSPIEVDHTTIEQDFWQEVNLEESIDLITEKSYWLVLKSKTGTAEWKGYLETNTSQQGRFKYTKNAGQTWNDHKVTGYFMLISDPPQNHDLQQLQVTVGCEGTGPEEVYIKEVSQPVKPVVPDKDINLDQEGKISVDLLFTGTHNGSIRLSGAFIDYRFY